jgi:glycine oxidase
MHERAGAVDNVRLLSAVAAAVARAEAIQRIDDDVSRVEAGPASVTVSTSSGRTLSAARVVLAAGAWSPRIAGLPRTLPVRPLKGQMLALAAAPLTCSIMGEDVYLVPRGRETLVGATVEEAGFDTGVDAHAIEQMRRAAVELCPELRDAAVARTWAGIRPATPDMLPIIGADPEVPSLVYACGHSKNGILLAPATAAALADVIERRESPFDLRPFRIDRWPPHLQ